MYPDPDEVFRRLEKERRQRERRSGRDRRKPVPHRIFVTAKKLGFLSDKRKAERRKTRDRRKGAPARKP